MQIFAMIVGLDDFAVTATIEPHETIATLFDEFEKQLLDFEMPHQFTAGYSIEHTQPGGFGDDDPDYIGMQNGDPDIVAKYLTPAARLDPQKTVADYFGTDVPRETISIALTWPAESLAQEKRPRELGRIAGFEWLIKQKEKQEALFRLTQAPMPNSSTKTKTTVPSNAATLSPTTTPKTVAFPFPWQWLATCLPFATLSRHDDAKKND